MHLTTLRNCIIPAWSPERLRCGGAAVKKVLERVPISKQHGGPTVSIQNRPVFRCSNINIQDFFEKTNKNLKIILLK